MSKISDFKYRDECIKKGTEFSPGMSVDWMYNKRYVFHSYMVTVRGIDHDDQSARKELKPIAKEVMKGVIRLAQLLTMEIEPDTTTEYTVATSSEEISHEPQSH